MRKYQVEKTFTDFCGTLLMPTIAPSIYGGKKAVVHFEIFGIQFSFYPLEGVARKFETRKVHIFKSARELFDFAKRHDAMRRSDPNFRE